MTEFILVRSDTGDGGWSLHTLEAVADADANDDVPAAILYGKAEWDEAANTWTRPNHLDYAYASMLAGN